MFLKNPLFGVGINSFLPSLPDFIIQQKTFFIQPVHNIYLLILSQIGIVGFSFFVFLLFKTFRKILKIKNYLIGILLIEILILGFFDHYFLTLQQGQLLFALVLGLSYSKLRYNIEWRLRRLFLLSARKQEYAQKNSKKYLLANSGKNIFFRDRISNYNSYSKVFWSDWLRWFHKNYLLCCPLLFSYRFWHKRNFFKRRQKSFAL